MGQILGTDQIANPSHSAGIITLPPSLLTLGGKMFRTGTLTRLISTDVTLVANTLYFIYGVVISGVPALRISLQAPSAYKIVNPTAKLVAAFYSNGLSSIGFGAFVSIESTPIVSERVLYTPTGTWTGNVSYDESWWSRNPNGKMLVKIIVRNTGTLVPTPSTGLVVNWVPTNNPGLDVYRIGNTAEVHITLPQTTAWSSSNSGNINESMWMNTPTTLSFGVGATSGVENLFLILPGTRGLAGVTGRFSALFEVPVIGWNNTPLVDL